MNKTLFLALLSTSLCSLAAPSSQVAWTAEQINFVKAGNAQKGQELAKTCAGCHGEKGVSVNPSVPSLAGQQANYLFKQLIDYKEGSRENPIMSGLAKTLSNQDAADLAVGYSTQPKAILSTAAITYPLAEVLVKQGNSERMLPPCEVCHGGKGEGQKMDLPALAGQNASYLSASLQAFKAGTRHNDVYSKMRVIAQALSEQEITDLGLYYQNIKQ